VRNIKKREEIMKIGGTVEKLKILRKRKEKGRRKRRNSQISKPEAEK
jgi:hypothetical protein